MRSLLVCLLLAIVQAVPELIAEDLANMVGDAPGLPVLLEGCDVVPVLKEELGELPMHDVDSFRIFKKTAEARIRAECPSYPFLPGQVRQSVEHARTMHETRASDTCATATVIPSALPAIVTDTTVGATTDGTLCNNAGNNVWFSFTAPATGTFAFTTCTGSNFDTVIQLFSSCGGASLACNDDSCGGFQSRFTRVLANGVNYLISVGGYIGETGTFNLTSNSF